MLFNSVFFLIVFLPISLLIYYSLGILRMNAAKWWLVLVSLVFYGWWSPFFLALLLGSILFNYGCGYLIQVFEERPRLASWALALGITANLSALFYYKYLMTLTQWFQSLDFYHGPAVGGLLLPLGISFFTFTQIGFLIDVREGSAKERGFLEYILFVTFFPHLIAGPILHHREMMPQFAKAETYRLRWESIAVGLSVFVIGLAKKVLIADQLAPIAADVFRRTGEKHVLEAWTGALCYSLQLYFDFAGYSEMAMGLARMFNVTFPANFDSPYKSKSIIDFWQRWHISLTRYLTLYLYNPVSLWIMRQRMAKGLPLIRMGETGWSGFFIMLVVPTMYTMILAGVWHGAGFQFLIFGLLHGVYLCVNHAWRFFGPKPNTVEQKSFLRWIDGAWKWALTYLAVLIAQVFFRAKTALDAWNLIRSMFGFGTGDSVGGQQGVVESVLDYFGVIIPYFNFSDALLTVVLGFVIILFLPNVLQIFKTEMISLTKSRSEKAWFSFEWHPSFFWAFTLVLLTLADLLMVTGNSEFLYFRF